MTRKDLGCYGLRVGQSSGENHALGQIPQSLSRSSAFEPHEMAPRGTKLIVATCADPNGSQAIALHLNWKAVGDVRRLTDTRKL